MSKYWTYYLKMPALQAQCNLCLKVIKTGGSTTNLRNHLKCKHKEHFDLLDYVIVENIYNEFNSVNSHDMRPEECDTMKNEVWETAPGNELNTFATFRSRSVSPGRSDSSNTVSLSDSKDDGEDPSTYGKGGSRYTAITNALLYMICKDCQPHLMVEKVGFLHYMETTQPLYEVPSSDEILEMITARYEALTSKIRTRLKEIEHLSLSCSVFTVKETPFLILVVHFVCPVNQRPEKICLGIRRMEVVHSPEKLGEAIQRILRVFDVPKTKITSVCTDGSQCMKTTMQQLYGDEKNISCLSFALNSIVNGVLDDVNIIVLKTLIDEIKTVVTYMDQNYFQAFSCLSEEEANDVSGLQESVNAIHPATWNSAYHMLDKFLRLLPCLTQDLENPHLEDVLKQMVSSPNIELLSEMKKLLAPFEEATKELLASECLTGSIVLPLLSCMESRLQNITLAHGITEIFRGKLLASLEACMREYSTNSIICRAVFCDPRFKKMYITPSIADNIVEECSAEMKQDSLQYSVVPTEETDSVVTLWKAHDEDMAKQKKTVNGTPYELEVYLGQILLPRTTDPFKFWLQDRGCMPNLSRVAIKNLTVCGSSVLLNEYISVLETIFSGVGFCTTEQHVIERVFLNQLDSKYWKVPLIDDSTMD